MRVPFAAPDLIRQELRGGETLEKLTCVNPTLKVRDMITRLTTDPKDRLFLLEPRLHEMKVTRDFADVQAAVVAEGTTLLLLDVDNTLLTCDGPGCEHWEKAMTAELLRLGCEQKDAWQLCDGGVWHNRCRSRMGRSRCVAVTVPGTRKLNRMRIASAHGPRRCRMSNLCRPRPCAAR